MGESIRKMALVPMDYHLNQPPVKAQLNELDSEMKNILDSTLPSDAKFKLYNHILHQHGAVSEEMKKPMKVEIKTEQPAVGKFSRDAALVGLPKTSMNSARLLAEHVEKNSDDIQFSDKGELITLGTPIKGSNSRDLFSYASRHVQYPPPRGWPEFKALLDQTQAPAKAIGNRNIHGTEAALAQVMQTPPGLAPSIFSPSPAHTPPGVVVQPRTPASGRRLRSARNQRGKGSGFRWDPVYK